jgi:hypothetical protein
MVLVTVTGEEELGRRVDSGADHVSSLPPK